MTEEQYKYFYSQRVKMSNGFKDLRPICLIMHEITCCEEDEYDQALLFARRLEKDLIRYNVLPSEIAEDCICVDTSTDAGKMQYYIWLLLRNIKERAEK